MASVGDGGGSGGDTSVINFHVKFSGRSIPITLTPDSTVKDLKSFLQPLTNVLPRGQKLIFKGKILVDSTTLSSSEVTNGSKLMLMASQGLHQGDGPITKEVPTTMTTSSNLKTNLNAKMMHDKIKEAQPVQKSRIDRWKLTGIVALQDFNLKIIPDEVWECGLSARVLEISDNSIQKVPANIASLSSMQKMFLNANDILDEGICWEGVASLKFLTVLSLNQNHLTALPSSLGSLTSLRQLHVSKNRLTCLPIEIGLLTQLEILKVSNNRISSLPSSIGNCSSLIEVDLSSNLLVQLPETFGHLQNLKALYLSNNGIKSLPSSLFRMCSQLSTLDLHGTEVTMDVLRQLEGWKDFDERRLAKHQKQLEFRVGDSAGFDEGADKN